MCCGKALVCAVTRRGMQWRRRARTCQHVHGFSLNTLNTEKGTQLAYMQRHAAAQRVCYHSPLITSSRCCRQPECTKAARTSHRSLHPNPTQRPCPCVLQPRPLRQAVKLAARHFPPPRLFLLKAPPAWRWPQRASRSCRARPHTTPTQSKPICLESKPTHLWLLAC